MGEDEKGKFIWRTIGGRRIKIYEGQDLHDAMKESGKFSKYVMDKLKKDTDGDNSASASDSSVKRKSLILKYKQEKEKALEEKQRDRKMKPVYEKMKSRHDRIIKELSRSEYDVGTYDMDTLKPIGYDTGYQVTFCRIGDNYDNNTYYKLCKKFLDVSSDGKVCAGKFEGTPEISFNVKDRDTAIALAKEYDQISIWDWANADEIKTGGKGRRL